MLNNRDTRKMITIMIIYGMKPKVKEKNEKKRNIIEKKLFTKIKE